ncbi:hypothetical protein MLD38_020892 [Melastoma candidum]|uniref:Uncharacterized protein n=1 Tax=Melastoma candidum TaxID=119954 RepID=A0ACB9QEG0_9MYRT|nr:hypothetical protein MLD38_020892 [Melastoma candidum]
MESVAASPALKELERIRTRILERISALERSLPRKFTESPAVAPPLCSRISCGLAVRGAFVLPECPGITTTVPSRSGGGSSAWIRSIDHLCKSIVVVNTQASPNVTDCSNRNNSKYFVTVVQYTARVNAEALKAYLYSLDDGKIPEKKFNREFVLATDSF